MVADAARTLCQAVDTGSNSDTSRPRYSRSRQGNRVVRSASKSDIERFSSNDVAAALA